MVIKVTIYWSIISFNRILPTIIWVGVISISLMEDSEAQRCSMTCQNCMVLQAFVDPKSCLSTPQVALFRIAVSRWWGLSVESVLEYQGYFWDLLFNESMSTWVRCVQGNHAIKIFLSRLNWKYFSLLFIKSSISLNIITT